MFHCACTIDFQDITAARIDFPVLNAEDSQSRQCTVEDCFRAGIDVQSAGFVMVQCNWFMLMSLRAVTA